MKHVIKLRRGRRGQALLLVTLSLFAMCGLLGLAVDLGWSYFVKKSAQNAADAAALAAAYQALKAAGQTGTFNPEGGGDCDLSGNLQTGCLYAEQNDFNPGGHGGRQKINIQDDQGPVIRQDGTTVPRCASNPGTAGCVEYRVTVRTVESIPQLFSAVLGNMTGLSSARATAAVVQEFVNGSLILLNRNDPGPNGPGIDAVANPITAPAGIVVASKTAGTIPNSGVTGPIIAMAPVATPGLPDGPLFLDPMRGYGQPPLPTTAFPCPGASNPPSCNTYAVIGGDMSGATGGIFQLVGTTNVADQSTNYAFGGSPTLPSGNYISATWAPGCGGPGRCSSVTLIGNQLSIGGGGIVTFGNGGFGNFFFYGGLIVAGGKIFMGPGEYVLVGGSGTGDLATSSTAEIDGTGAIIIFTGASGPFTLDVNTHTATGPADLYPNLLTEINSNRLLVDMATGTGQLAFGPISLSTGPAGNVSGLDANSSTLPQNLIPFGGIVLWQDQANSTVKYAPDGNIDLSCGGINTPCTKGLPSPPVLNVQTQYALGFSGTIYQPRGAWINIGPGTLAGNLQVITGAVTGGAGSAMGLTPPPANLRLRRRVVALIE